MGDPNNPIVVARVRVVLDDGSEEIWMVPTSYVGPHYRAVVYPPDEDARIEYTHVLRSPELAREIPIDERRLHTEGSQEEWQLLSGR